MLLAFDVEESSAQDADRVETIQQASGSGKLRNPCCSPRRDAQAGGMGSFSAPGPAPGLPFGPEQVIEHLGKHIHVAEPNTLDDVALEFRDVPTVF